MIKAVIFDLDNTLFDYERGHRDGMEALCAYGERVLQIPREELLAGYQRVLERGRREMGFHNADIHNRVLRFAHMLEEWDRPVFPHVQQMCRVYWEPMLDACQPFPGALEFLSRAKQAGLVLGVGTDMTSYMQYEKLERLGAGPYLDFVVTSEEAMVEKPHPDFFALCLRKAGAKVKDLQPGECMFVGDHLEKDVKGALRSGMKGVWYQPDLSVPQEDVPWRVKDYEELQRLLGQMQETEKEEENER